MLDNNDKKTTYVFDTESATEMARLIQLDQLLTRGADGPLSGVDNYSQWRNVLDLACGPGGWVLDVAFDCPNVEVAGIDISQTMISYANARARAQGLHNASFGIMDILQPLDFADASFDMVNSRLLAAVLKQDAWPLVLAECFRLLRPGGVIRLTEIDEFGLTSSSAYEELKNLGYRMLARAGHGFSPDGRTQGITPKLGHLLQNAGFKDIQRDAHVIDYSAGTAGWKTLFDQSVVVTSEAKPFLLQSKMLSEERFDELYQRMQIEMLAEDFCAVLYYQTILGTKGSE